MTTVLFAGLLHALTLGAQIVSRGDLAIPYQVRCDLRISAYRRLLGKAAAELPQPWPTAPPVQYFALTKYDDPFGNVIRPVGKPFRGKFYVLIDANNSSATFQFAQTVQQNKLGTFIGQPTGGSQRGINGGAFFFLRLPRTQIEIDVPLIGSFPATPQPDSGLAPDIFVAPTVEDIIAGRDVEMATVSALQKK